MAWRACCPTLAGTVIAVSMAVLAGTTVLWQEQQLGLRNSPVIRVC